MGFGSSEILNDSLASSTKSQGPAWAGPWLASTSRTKWWRSTLTAFGRLGSRCTTRGAACRNMRARGAISWRLTAWWGPSSSVTSLDAQGRRHWTPTHIWRFSSASETLMVSRRAYRPRRASTSVAPRSSSASSLAERWRTQPNALLTRADVSLVFCGRRRSEASSVAPPSSVCLPLIGPVLSGLHA